MDSTGGADNAARVGVIGTAIGIYAYADALVLGTLVVFLSALTVPLIVFGIAAVLLFFVNLWMCNWIERQWDVLIVGRETRFEKRLAKLRKGRVMRHPVRWITGGSAGMFALAAALMNAVTVVAAARLIGRRARRGAADLHGGARILGVLRWALLDHRVRRRGGDPRALAWTLPLPTKSDSASVPLTEGHAAENPALAGLP